MTDTPGVAPTDTFMVQRMGAEEGPYSLADLQAQVRSGSVKYNTLIRRGTSNWFNATEVPGLFSEKEWLVALLLSLVPVVCRGKCTVTSCGPSRSFKNV